MATECNLCLLSDDDRRRVRPYLVVAASAYLGSLAVATIVILCNCFGVLDSGKYVMSAALMPVIVRYFVLYPICRRTAAMTGEPVPKVLLLGYLMLFAFLGLYITALL